MNACLSVCPSVTHRRSVEKKKKRNRNHTQNSIDENTRNATNRNMKNQKDESRKNNERTDFMYEQISNNPKNFYYENVISFRA